MIKNYSKSKMGRTPPKKQKYQRFASFMSTITVKMSNIYNIIIAT